MGVLQTKFNFFYKNSFAVLQAGKVCKLLDAVSRLASCRLEDNGVSTRPPDIRSVSRDRTAGPIRHHHYSGSADQLSGSDSWQIVFAYCFLHV
jgi:hypothetical protein